MSLCSLYLSPYDLSPTYKEVHNRFSARYYLNLVLVDEEDRRYFKQQEITLYRKEDDPTPAVSSSGGPVHAPAPPSIMPHSTMPGFASAGSMAAAAAAAEAAGNPAAAEAAEPRESSEGGASPTDQPLSGGKVTNGGPLQGVPLRDPSQGFS